MSRDIVDTSTPFNWLVVASGVEGEPADQLACVGGEDPDRAISDEELHRPPLVSPAKTDVMQTAVMAHRDCAGGIDFVLADAKVGLRSVLSSRPSLDLGAVGL